MGLVISLVQVSKSFGGHAVLSDVSLSVVSGQRLGLVGRNGTGKTTLLRLLAGVLEPDSGHVAPGPDVRVGYLRQEGQLEPDRTLYEEMDVLFDPVRRMEGELRRLERDMEALEGSALQACMARYATLQAEYEHAEPHTVDARIRTVLSGLGFGREDLDRPCREFSGGWQMRGAMARLLLSAPTVLLLDEPTNHLDLEATEWLEDYLAAYRGVVILVSHDRTFLDRSVNRIVELRAGGLEDYPGNYSFYLEERRRRREARQSAYDAQQRKLADEQHTIERFRYKATLASRMQSREKMLDRLERVEAPLAEQKPMRLTFLPSPDSGREALVLKGACKAYGAIQVLCDVTLKVERGERLAVVGVNGAGKSTLLKLMAELEAPDRGTVRPGYRLTPAYFAQHQAEALDPGHTALESLEEVAPPGVDQTRLRTLLGCLLFTGDEVHKRVAVLSGGERSRVALARCIVRPSNLLLLDEPTNHLDLEARESLAEALEEYPGTVVLISHDRSFMNRLATGVLEVRDGGVERHLGNYADFQRKRRKAAPPPPGLAESNQKGRDLVAPSRRAKSEPGRGKPRPWSLPALEARIFGLEEEIAGIAEAMALPEVVSDPHRVVELKRRYEALNAECRELTALWDQMTG
ncbi:MAG: ABC-F family ATP-binding cassette domain-containing protein [Candidatus Eremiobacterota bacterium]